MKKLTILLLILTLGFLSAEAKKEKEDDKKQILNPSLFNGLTWRSIGPAFVSGRIADFAVNPENHSIYYVAVASEFQAMAHLPNVNNAKIYEPEPGVIYTWGK